MNFIQSKRADVSYPINLDHVVAIKKDKGYASTTEIIFDTSSGKSIIWKYYRNKTNRDLDYEQIMLVIFMPEQEDNNV